MKLIHGKTLEEWKREDPNLHRIIETHQGMSSEKVEINKLIAQIFRTVDFYWIPFVYGMYIFLNKTCKKSKSQNLLSFATTLLLCFVLMPIWPYYIDRIFFMTAPFILLFTINGISYFKELHQYTIVLLFGVMAQIITYLIYAYDVSGLLIYGVIITCSLFIIGIYLNRKELS